MTGGDGHVIDPAGDARRALQAVVAEQGPEALSNAVIMDGICQARLSHLPGEAIIIGSAARSDVPRLLGDLIPRLGNYGAIQSVAATLAQAHGLDTAASVWVVREFARALGLIASGGTQPTARGGPAGSAGAGGGAAASGMAAGSGAAGMGATGGTGGAGVPGGTGGAGEPGGAGGAGGVPRRPSSGGRGLSRNTIGIAAAIAVVAGYLGVAGVAHLSPFPAKAVVATSSTSAPPNQGNNTSPSPAASPDPTPDPSPPSDYQVLLTKIPNVIRGTNNCHNDGTGVGAIAVSECTGLQGVAARVIFYYLFSGTAALGNGFSTFLKNENFTRRSECTTNNNFVSFVAECESNFTGTSPAITGSIAEYVNKNNEPIIVSTDNQQQVMAVMVGTNDGDLLAYWKLLQWVVP